MAVVQSVQVKTFSCTVLAGVPIANPVSFNCSFDQSIVHSITVRVPPGPNGNVGFVISSKQSRALIPDTGVWVVTDDEIITWDLTDQNDSGSWWLTAYNTGAFDHTLQVEFAITPTVLGTDQGQMSAAAIDTTDQILSLDTIPASVSPVDTADLGLSE